MNKIKELILKINNKWKLKEIRYFLAKKEYVLDFGCGDGYFADSLKLIEPSLKITGVDIIGNNNNNSRVEFVKYNGSTLPFSKDSFNTVVAINVFHHIPDFQTAIKECLRVGKRLLIVEPIARFTYEKKAMGFMDKIYNLWKEEKLKYPENYFEIKEIEDVINKNRFKITSKKRIYNIFSIIPIGATYIFEVKNK